MTMYAAMIALDDAMERVVVIVKRRPPEQDGLVSFPGGHVEDYDWRDKLKPLAGWTEDDREAALKRCAIRETVEETGLAIRAGRCACVHAQAR